MRYFCFTLIMMIFVIAFIRFPELMTTTAQDEGWSVTIYDAGINALVTLSRNQNQTVALPDINFYVRPFENILVWYLEFANSFRLSDDHRYLAALVQDDTNMRETIIIDLFTQSITPVEVPHLDDEEFFVGYRLGTFNPIGTDIALSYVSHDATSGFGCCDSGGIVTVDLETGLITRHLNTDDIYYDATARIDHWSADGIWFTPRCSGCAPPFTYTYSIWNVRADAITDTRIFNDSWYSERLWSTGELLYSENHSEFVLGGESFPPQLNVVSIYNEEHYPPESEGQVIFYETTMLDFDQRAHWIMGGHAFLVTNRQLMNRIVHRNGQQYAIDYASTQIFLAMTGDGWLSIDQQTNHIWAYTIVGNLVEASIVYEAHGEVVVANTQIPATSTIFPEFAIDITPPNISFCPGTLPSRMIVGDWAEVIESSPDAYIQGLFIGDVPFEELSYDERQYLPVGTRVRIIDMPVCDGYDATYVKVNYEGVIGWLMESWHTTYLLAPLETE